MKLKNKTKEKLIMNCVSYLGMDPDSAENFVEEFPRTAIKALENAKVESEKRLQKENGEKTKRKKDHDPRTRDGKPDKTD